MEKTHIAFLDQIENIQVGIIVFESYFHNKLEIRNCEFLRSNPIMVPENLCGYLQLFFPCEHRIFRYL